MSRDDFELMKLVNWLELKGFKASAKALLELLKKRIKERASGSGETGGKHQARG